MDSPSVLHAVSSTCPKHMVDCSLLKTTTEKLSKNKTNRKDKKVPSSNPPEHVLKTVSPHFGVAACVYDHPLSSQGLGCSLLTTQRDPLVGGQSAGRMSAVGEANGWLAG